MLPDPGELPDDSNLWHIFSVCCRCSRIRKSDREVTAHTSMEFLEAADRSCILQRKNEVQDILKKSEEEVKTLRSESGLNLNVSEITSSLYLAAATSVNPSTFKQLGITCIINAAVELPQLPLPPHASILYYKIDVEDAPNVNLKEYFNSAANLIHQVDITGGRTLVHCVAGISRSASLCIAYLMKIHNYSLREAYNYVKLRRPIIRPNIGFFKQLIDYEKELFRANTVVMVYNELLNTEVPDVYDSQYRGVSYFRKKGRTPPQQTKSP